MPVVVQIDKSLKLVRSTFTGEISEDDLRAAVAELPREPGFDPTFSHLIDFTNVTEAKISTEFVRNLARQQSLFHCNVTQVVVAPQSYIFGLARMAEILRGNQFGIVKVVKSLAEAYEELGLERPANQPPRKDPSDLPTQ